MGRYRHKKSRGNVMKIIGSFSRMLAIAGSSVALAASGAHAQSGLLTKGTDLEPITLSP
jgi:hypothetical protein